MLIPEHLRYTPDHLWIEISRATAKIGITDYAQELLGNISFVELPEAEAVIEKQGKLATIEGLKSVIDIFSPLTCRVIRPNLALKTNPKLINTSPYDEGWIAELSISNVMEIDALLTAAGYAAAAAG